MPQDAPGMLEWMTDPEVNLYFQFDPGTVSLETVQQFIARAGDEREDRHFAIAGEGDEYQGTVSLKHISPRDRTAEYAIALRQGASGKGLGSFATREVLRVGFVEMDLHKIYLNVYADNQRALSLYEKCGFRLEGEFKQHLFVRGEYKDLKWYGMLRCEYDRWIDGR